MNNAQYLANVIRKTFPLANVELDPPESPLGPWWIDVNLGEKHINIEWHPNDGFGISLISGNDSMSRGYGDGPDIVLTTLNDAQDHVIHLLKEG